MAGHAPHYILECSSFWRPFRDDNRYLNHWPFVRGIHQLLVDSPHIGTSDVEKKSSVFHQNNLVAGDGLVTSWYRYQISSSWELSPCTQVWGEAVAGHGLNEALEFSSFYLETFSWWCYGMELLSLLLALCEGNPLVTGRFPSQRASNVEFWCFLCCLLCYLLEGAVEWIGKSQVIPLLSET